LEQALPRLTWTHMVVPLISNPNSTVLCIAALSAPVECELQGERVLDASGETYSHP